MADDNVSAPKTHKMALDKEKASLLDYASTLAPFCWTNTVKQLASRINSHCCCNGTKFALLGYTQRGFL